MKAPIILLFAAIAILVSCGKDDPISVEDCPVSYLAEDFNIRKFKMGFSTWSYGPDLAARNQTYDFIEHYADVYSEHIDNKIPWSAWINDEPLPSEFVNEIEGRASTRIPNNELLVSVSILNSSRSDLAEDFDGTIPNYTSLSDQTIEDAYFKHLEYIIAQLQPDYFVMAIEVNDLKNNSPSKWEGYKVLAGNLRIRLKASHPNLKLSESITLHNWLAPDVDDPAAFQSELSDYVNQHHDFTAISFYPFFRNLHTAIDFQGALDFLHERTNKPIAFVETTHLAEDLIIPNLSTNISSDHCEQRTYLEMLLNNAQIQDYEFVIWWAHRDYDALWETFPDEVKDLGQVWRDTGLLDEDGNERPVYDTWIQIHSLNFQE